MSEFGSPTIRTPIGMFVIVLLTRKSRFGSPAIPDRAPPGDRVEPRVCDHARVGEVERFEFEIINACSALYWTAKSRGSG